MAQDVLAGLAGVLLMGGESRRMGRDKGSIPIDGKPLWERQWELLGTVARPRYRTVPSGHPHGEGILPDPAPSPGPLPGIAAALAAMPGDWLLVLAVDLIGVDARTVAHLYRERVTGGVVMPRLSGQAQPLLAIWHRDVRPAIETALAGGERAVQSVLARVPCRVIDLPAALESGVTHVNTPDELSAYEMQRHRRWLQIVGYSGVGKTALLSLLVSRLVAEGESVTAVKLTHHDIQAHPGADSGKLRSAGAETAWLAGPDGLFREGAPDPDAVKRLARGMWLVVEGGRHWPTPKIVLGGDRWPEHAAPIVGSVGNLRPLARRHLAARMPEGAARAADWIFEHRFLLSAPLGEVARG